MQNSPEKKPLHVGIVGAGRGGRALLEVFSGMERIKVVGICDRDPDAPGLEIARRQGIPIYEAVSRLIENHSMEWLINVSDGSITQRHLLAREMDGVQILDGAAAQVVWRVLAAVREELGQEDEREGLLRFDRLGGILMDQVARAMRGAQEELTGFAFHDTLTGLFTRRMLMEFLDREIRRTFRLNRPISVLLVDVDRFKSVNDQFGHGAGDLVLKDLANLLQSIHRPSDLVARLGGEEFVVVLPETGVDSAMQTAERIRVSVCERVLRPDTTPLTVSIGVAALNHQDPPMTRMSPALLLECADRALYQAKQDGRNRVVLHQPDLDRIVIT